MMKRILTLGLMTLMILPVVGSASSDVRITSGTKGGSYYGVFGRNLSQVLTEQGYSVELMTSDGAFENLSRIDAGEADFGFTQGDVLAQYMKDHPTAGIEMLGQLGNECVFMASREDGDIDDVTDLKRSDQKVAVGPRTSGSYGSWNYLQQLEDNYLEVQTVYSGGARAFAALQTGGLDAILWVTTPTNMGHQYFEFVQAENSGMRLIDVNDWDLNGELPNGNQVYEFQDVVVSSGFFSDDEVEVPCTGMYVVGGQTVDSELLDTVAAEIITNQSRLTAVE